MNLLFVANRFPYPPYRGDKLKIFNLAKQLSKRHDLYLITFLENKEEYKYKDHLLEYFKDIKTIYLPKHKSVYNCLTGLLSEKPLQVHYFRSGAFKNILREFISKHNIDIIHTQHLRMSQYTYDIKEIPTVLDLPDAYSLYWKRRCNISENYLKKEFDLLEYRKVQRYESIIKHFDMTFVCSEEDKSLLKNEQGYDRISILPNGIDTTQFADSQHDYSINNRIIFTGNMSYFPNADAAVYFSKEIFPAILNKVPGVKFYIVGQNPPKKVIELQNKNIIVTGFVESIADEYRKSAIAVSPVRVGAGTMNKVLEPMAMGVPVISSLIGFEGLNAAHGNDILLARNKHEFIESSVNLLTEKNYRRHIGENGKELVIRNFSWERIAERLENYFYQILDKSGKSDQQDIRKLMCFIRNS